jgi:putative ABC transport system permease protein
MASLADRLYRLLLRCLPRAERRDFGEDMVQLFRDQRRAAGLNPLRLLSLWVAAAGDVFREAAAARRRRSRGGPRAPGTWTGVLAADFRSGLRLLRRYPSTSLLAIATLALGIGANTAIFSVVDAVLLRALPYPAPARLMMVFEKRPREGTLTNPVSPADFLDWRRLNTVFEHMAGFTSAGATLTDAGAPAEIGTGIVSWAFFDVLGVPPALGRTFTPADETEQQRVLVISHAFWQQRLGADPDVIGRTLTLNGSPWKVIGVLPANFAFVDPNLQVWAPLALEGQGQPPSRVLHWLDVYARLKPGVTQAQAVAAMDRLGQALERAHPEENSGHGANAVPMQDYYVRTVRAGLLAQFAAVGLVLLIACVNVAGLLLVRASTRRREMALRSALGASRARLLVQTMVESATLGLAGGMAGLAASAVLLRALPAVLPARLSVVGVDELHLNLRLLVFALAVSVATGLLFGLLPALQSSRPDVAGILQEGGRTPVGVRRRARRLLVGGEVALASLTLLGAGLVLRSFATILSQPLGFDPAHRLTFRVSVPASRYPTEEAQHGVLTAIENRLRQLPGVTGVGGIDLLPLGGEDSRTGVEIEGRAVREDDPPTRMHPRIVTPTYFRAAAIPILRGRTFTPADRQGAPPVVIVSEAAARRYWPGRNPLGLRMRFNRDGIWRTVVGVAANVRHWGLAEDVQPMVYQSQAQAGATALTFILDTSRRPDALAEPARRAVAAIDPDLPLIQVRTFEAVVSRSLRAERAQAVLMTAFGGLALLLAVIGIYGVMAQLVAGSTREIGIRISLGAAPARVLRGLLLEGLWQTLIGLAIGLVAGAWVMRLGRSLLFEVQPWDPVTLAGVSATLVLAALAACLVPARRAMRIDPVDALRQ